MVSLTIYSFVTAIIWFSLFILLSEMIRRKIGYTIYCNINILLIFIALAILRLFLPIEFSTTQVIDATVFLSFTKNLSQPIFTIFSLPINGFIMLVSVWVCGIVFCLFSLFSRMAKAKTFVKHLVRNSIKDQKIERYIKSNLQIRHKRCSVIVSPEVSTPMATGLLHPTILLPETALELSKNSLQNVLTHETTHILNKDLWVKFLVEVVCCVLWFNPIVYLLRRGLDNSLELRCDYYSTRNMVEQEKYSYLLTIMYFLKNKTTKKPDLLPAFGSQFLSISEDFNIKQRFKLISAPYRNTKIKSLVFVLLMFGCFVFSYMVVFQPKHNPPLEDLIGTYELSADNAYIVVSDDGEFTLKSDYGDDSEILECDLDSLPYTELPMVFE